MQLRSKLTGVGLASLLALAGCGGGGGTPAASTVALSGSAAKGILIDAEVNVYSLVGGKKADKPLGTTTTNSMGQYTLNIPLTTDPVMIEVKAVQGTKMLDETLELVDGKFREVAAPTGLTMRSFAANASQETVVRVNPLTEMAVAVAENATGGLSINNLFAGQRVAIEAAPAGVNPFTQEPVAEPASMDADQLKFAIKMAGLMSSASGTCALQCQIDSLSENVKFELDSNGVATFSPAVTQRVAEKSLTLLTAGADKLTVNDANQVNKRNSTATVIKAAAQTRVTTPVALVTAKPEEVLAANGLQGFVDAMRNGFRTTEERLLKVEKELDERYKDVTMEGVSFIGNVLYEIEAACTENNAGQLSCTSGSTRAFKWTSVGNATFNWETTTPNLGRTSTGSVVGSEKNGMNTLTVNGQIVKGTKELVAMQNLEISLLNKGDADFRATINGTLTANDDKNLVVTLKFDGVDFKSVPRSNNPALADLTFKGGLSIAANNGDKLSGTIDLTGVEFAKNMNFYTDYQQFITAGTLNLEVVTTSTNVLALDVSLKTALPDYTKPIDNTNYETYDGTFKLALTDSVALTFTESSTVWHTANRAVTIKSGTSEVRLNAEYKELPLGTPPVGWCEIVGGGSSLDGQSFTYRCATEIKLTSSNANPYTATLKRVNGKTTGDILLGTTKVGEFVNGVMKINGAEVSLY